jgi:hypothetical protein
MGGKWDLQRTCIGLTWEVHINELWKMSFLFHLINEKILLKLYDYHLFAVTLPTVKKIDNMRDFVKIIFVLCAVTMTVACTRPNRNNNTTEDPLSVKYENDLFSIDLPSGWEIDDSGWLGLDSMQNEVEIHSSNSPVWFHIVKTFIPIQWKNVYEATEMAIAARAMSGANVELIKRTDSVEVGGYPTSILYFANVVDKDTIIQKQYVTYLEDSHIVIYFNENFYSNQWDEAQKYGEKIIGSVKLKKVVNPLEKDSVMKEAIQKAMDGKKIQQEYIEKGKKIVNGK